MRAISPHPWVELFILLTRRVITIDLFTVGLTTQRLKSMWLNPIRLCVITLWLYNILCADDHQCRRLEVWDLVRVVSLEQCDLPCAVEFDWCRENRFEVRGFVPWHTRDISWEGDVDVMLRSEHDEYV